MFSAGNPGREAGEVDEMLRHRDVPFRVLGDKLVVARPRDGAPVVLAPTAAFVWRILDGWTTPRAIDRRIAEAFPEVDATDRMTARTEILEMLRDDDLVERS
jgi:hypothetical protein